MSVKVCRGVLASLALATAMPAGLLSPAWAAETRTGYSIFTGTMADMTWPEVKGAADAGAIAIWGLAVIEEHGPALPLATDTYAVTASANEVQSQLARRNIPSVIVPAYYWGVNVATGGFPGTINVRPEIMAELMVDVVKSLKNSGFKQVYCLPGHGDTDHNRAIYEGVKRAAATQGIEVFMVTQPAMLQRLGADPGDGRIVLTASTPAGPAPKFIDGHSGAGETSTMLGLFPDVVRKKIVPTLKPTNLGPSDLAKWRTSPKLGRSITPLGYFGQPAEADPTLGRTRLVASAASITDAIAKKVSDIRAAQRSN
jgi:creatinine amidohydrolase